MPPLRKAGIAAAFVFSAAALAQTSWPPDHAKANIGGREGMLAFPADEKRQPIEPRNCVVRLAPTETPEQRFTYACGEWFLPPGPGAYRCWLEMDGRVSAVQTILREAADTPFRGTGFVVLHETVPAGYVSVSQKVPPGHTVRYLHLDQPGYGFSLRVPPDGAAKPSSIPPGRVMAGIFREDTDEAVAHSRPVVVEKGKTTDIRIDSPKDGSDLLVMLRKPSGTPLKTGAMPQVSHDKGLRDPDVLYESRNWFVALWYGLPATMVTLSLDAAGLELKETKVQLAPQKIATIRRDLTKKLLLPRGREERLRNDRLLLSRR
jgi:hypothetical protein